MRILKPYHLQPPQNPRRPYTRRSMNPHPGISPARRTALGYRYASSHGDGIRFRVLTGTCGVSRPTANCSLLTADWTYSYDNLYRMTKASGRWESQSMGLTLLNSVSMFYSANGRVTRKRVSAGTLQGSQPGQVQYIRSYQYLDNPASNRVDSVTDALSGTSHLFEWDECGNMTRHDIQGQSHDRRLFWTEDNRLQFVKDNGSTGTYYQYDAGGDRTYKLLYHKTTGSLNGVQTDYYTLDDATLYVSPYLVVTPQGYTKHYYAESERITTQLGKSRFAVVDSCVAGSSSAAVKLQAVVTMFPSDSFPTPTAQLGYLHSLTNHPNTASTLYFYHPDHLGSASWITNIYGRTIQHLYYLPWGEDFVNQRTGSFSSMFTFSAKEKDAETGYSYFGARYYSSDLSVWLSVDPMSDKYPYQSGYVYCGNNPIKVIDPNGEDEWEVNKSGHIRHVDGSEGTPDKLFVVRGFGKKRFKERIDGEGLNVDADLMKGLCDSEGDGKIVFSKTHSDDKLEKMEEMFNFLADNTNVEWALATVDVATGYGLTLERTDFLITDHHRTRCETATALTVNCSRNGGLIRMKHSHPAYYSLVHLLDDSSISKPSGNPHGTDHKGDYGHKRLCTKPENSPNAIFILRHRGHERTY